MKKEFEKYLDQPHEFPKELERLISGHLKLYAYWDLDEQMHFLSGWCVLSGEKIYFFRNGELEKEITISLIGSIREFQIQWIKTSQKNLTIIPCCLILDGPPSKL